MAGGSLLTLLDDIATLMDDVALLTKMAGKKTAGVLGDDLALNAQQVAGVRADRELPVVWAVAKGSAINKAILVPAALAISAFAPWLVTPLLMVGGLFLCFEGFEKVAHKLLHSKDDDRAEHAKRVEAMADPTVDMVEFEKRKIKGAIRTDFILSAEIIAITLGVVAQQPLLTQAVVLSIVAILITIFVYGLVAGIVKLDDLGLYLSKKGGEQGGAGLQQAVGRGILWAAPYLMKGLSILGTAAMFLVGGGILVHGIPGIESWIHHVTERTGSLIDLTLPILVNALVGVAAGGVTVAVVTLIKRVVGSQKSEGEAET